VARIAIWTLVGAAVVLGTRTLVYALAPQSVLLAALEHDEAGPNLTVPLAGGVLIALVLAAAALSLAVIAVQERIRLDGRRLVRAPRLRPSRLAVRLALLFAGTSFAFAMLESTIHWREGLGWHGMRCLVGPVHRDAIPILAALSLLAVALHGAVEHLVEWARRLVARLLAAALPLALPEHRLEPSRPAGRVRPSRANATRGPPPARSVSVHLS
jgi:hypothetical protein